jgi:hypothetical protein
MVLYEKSGRQFSGLCTRTVRPCRESCGCFGDAASGLGWYWGGYGAAYSGGGFWRNECGDRCGCGTLSRVRLAGYPVRSVTEVKIDGVVMAALDANGNPNYRLDSWRSLVRMDDPGPPSVPRSWPACQNLSLAETKPGTFSITYQYGVDPPQLGRDAAAQLACELYKSCHGADCQLPVGATKVVRQGVTVDRGLLANWLDPSKPTGLVLVDSFLAAYWPRKTGRRPLVYSPDIQPFARKVGP